MSIYYANANNFKKDTDDIFCMTGSDLDIELNPVNAISYFATTEYDQQLASTAYSWHMIIVHHQGKYNKSEIINGFFYLVQDNEFYPVRYREYNQNDKFLVRNCPAAIHTLFEVGLHLPIAQGHVIPLTINLNMGEYYMGQVSPTNKIVSILQKQLLALEIAGSCSNVLNLNVLKNHPELIEIIINLGNKSAFELFCKIIQQKQEDLSHINGLKLISNNINNLAPIEALSKLNLQMVDLRCNNIKEMANLKFLKCFNIVELNISGNPVAQKPGYIDEVKEILPSLTKLDGIEIRKMQSKQSAVHEEDFIEITSQNLIPLNDFKKYKNSPMWHLVVVHHNGNFTKAEIIDALFATFPIQTNNFYPCYYEIGSDKDTFLVRNNFDHLETFLSNSLIIGIPNSEDTITITIQMNVANFKPGQVKPHKLITNVVGDCFSAADRILNLENFSSSAALKDLTISLGNTKTLNTILVQCARRYHSKIVELRLANNDIISGKGMLQSLSLMKNLKVIDLSNNRIENLTDLNGLEKSSVKDLRLNGNPLCEKYPIANVYIKEVKNLFPKLTKLDGVTIPDVNSIATEKNCSCSVEVEQFLTNYFNMNGSSPLIQKLVEKVSLLETQIRAQHESFQSLQDHILTLCSTPTQHASQSLPTDNSTSRRSRQHERYSERPPSSILEYRDRSQSPVSGWNVSFDGTKATISVEDLIRRLDIFQYNDMVSDEYMAWNIHRILSGRAEQWYWQFLRRHPKSNWPEIKAALLRQYGELASDIQILREIMNRKQGSRESFDDFLYTIQSMNHRRRVLLPDSDLIEIMRENVILKIATLIFTSKFQNIEEFRNVCLRAESHLARLQHPNYESRMIQEASSETYTEKVVKVCRGNRASGKISTATTSNVTQ